VSEGKQELKENDKIIVEEKVVGYYSDLFKRYSLEKIKIHNYPDGKKNITIKNLEGENKIIDLNKFLEERRQKIPEIRVFSKEELLDDFFEKIKLTNNEGKIRDLAKSAFMALGEENMSQYYLNNIEKKVEKWPKTIIIKENPGPMDERIESAKHVGIPVQYIITGKTI